MLDALLLASSVPSAAGTIPRMFLSLAVVIGIMWIAARVLKNRQVPGSGLLSKSNSAKNSPALQVIARQGMGGKTAVAIVRAGDKQLVVGITEGNVSLLAELDDADLSATLTSGMSKHLEIVADQENTKSRYQGTGTSGVAATAASTPTRKGLIESVREMTVRK